MFSINKSKIIAIPLLLLLILLGLNFVPVKPASAATNIFTDNFSNIAGWDRKGVVVNFGLSWEGTMLQDPSVLYNQGGGALFKMWYGAATRIGYATSNDGITWSKSANPMLTIGANGATDDSWLTVPSVVLNNGVYYMTYCGYDGAVARIHLATATNPAGPWTKQGVVLSPDQAYEDNFLYNSSLMYDGQWKMWYTAGKIASAGGEPEFIAYATASNPAGPWTKFSGNPIVSSMGDGGWLNIGVGGPNVIKKNNTYYMTILGWQNDYPSRGGRLTSTNGTTWTVARDKMHFDLGTVGTWEDSMIYRQYVVDVNGTEYMYYNAKDTQAGWNERIGLAIWNGSLPIINPAKWSKTFGPNVAGGGTFTIDAGRLKTMGVAPAGSQQILQGNVKVNTANYSISVDVTPLSSTDVQKDNVLLIRSTDLRNYYYAGISAWGGKYAIGKMVNGVNTKLVSSGTASQITSNTTYKLKLVANGSTIQLYDNGVLVLSATDSSLNPGASYVGLETSSPGGQAYFDNVSVDTVDSNPPPSFNDNFDDGNANGWTTYGGTWTVTATGCSICYGVTAGPGYKSVANGTNFSNFTYYADVNTNGGGDSGLIFRASNFAVGADALTGYYAGINAAGNVVLGKMNNNWTQLATAPVTIPPNTWHAVKVVAAGSLIRVYVDDMVTPKITVTDTSYSSGAIGVRSHNTIGKFDAISVTP